MALGASTFTLCQEEKEEGKQVLGERELSSQRIEGFTPCGGCFRPERFGRVRRIAHLASATARNILPLVDFLLIK